MSDGLSRERRWGAKTAEERRAERRGRLIRAAVKVYGAAGYRSATVKAVCEAAGLTERYFYESFDNSEDLLCSCFQHVNAGLLGQMKAAARQTHGAPMEKVRAALVVYFLDMQKNPASARVFLIEMSSVSERTRALVDVSLREFGDLLVDVLHDDAGFAGRPSALLLRGVVGGGLHIAQAWLAGGCLEPVESVAATALGLYALILRRTPATLSTVA